MKRIRGWAAFLAALALFLVISYTAGTLLMPPRTVYGCTWSAFCAEEKDSTDALFFGSSVCYCNVIPAVMWEETGLRSYVVAGPEQTMPITYYYIREACRTQSPRLIAVELTGMFFNTYQNYTKANIGYMPFGINRLAATFAAAEQDERLGLLFPLYSYHHRWREVSRADLRQHIAPAEDLSCGYTLLTKSVQPQPSVKKYSAETEVYRNNLLYLEKIAAYCRAGGMELLCYLAPTEAKIPEDALQTLREDTAALDISLWELCDRADDMGIVDAEDWYDAMHFNVRGAEKFSRYMAARIKDTYDIQPGAADGALWQRRLSYIRSELAAVQTEKKVL